MRYQVPVTEEESVLKPLSALGAAICQTSPGDMLLFMIALNRKQEEEKRMNESLTSSEL